MGAQVTAAVVAILAALLIALRWSIARALLIGSNRAFGARFDPDGREANTTRALLMGLAAVLIGLSIAVLYGLL